MPKLNLEAELFPGLEPFALAELEAIGAKVDAVSSGVIRFRFGKSPTRLGVLRVVSQIFEIHWFDVPRPKSLLGQQNFDRLASVLSDRIGEIGPNRVESFRLEAAGKESQVFQRIIGEIEKRLKIKHDPEGGDLFIRVKPSKQKRKGWEVLIRMTLRPLTTRPWRGVNYPGALSGPIAAAMLELAEISPGQTVINLMCGSGTLLAETQKEDLTLLGCDLNREALMGAQQNLKRAGKEAYLQQANVNSLPYGSNFADVILGDLPWAQRVGDSKEMEGLYMAALREAFRVCKPDGRFVVITQLKANFNEALKSLPWKLEERFNLKYNRVSPAIYLLRKPN